MKIKIDLPDEYWYALSELSKDRGHISRHDFVASILKKVVDDRPDYLARGRAEKVIIDARKNLKNGSTLIFDDVPLPMMRNYHTMSRLRYRVEWREEGKESTVVDAPNQHEAFKAAMGRYPVSDQEFKLLIKDIVPI